MKNLRKTILQVEKMIYKNNVGEKFFLGKIIKN